MPFLKYSIISTSKNYLLTFFLLFLIDTNQKNKKINLKRILKINLKINIGIIFLLYMRYSVCFFYDIHPSLTEP